MAGEILCSETIKGPFGIDTLLSINHKAIILSMEQVRDSSFLAPMLDPLQLHDNLTGMYEGNNFNSCRLPFLPLLQRVMQEIFSNYLPAKRQISLLEVGPGPFAYAAANGLIPFSAINEYSMLEASASYCSTIASMAQEHNWILYQGDINIETIPGKKYDAILFMSSIDSTPFIQSALANAKKMLNKDGKIIIVQDVLPAGEAIVALEYLFRLDHSIDKPIEIGSTIDQTLLWIKSLAPWGFSESGKISSPEYWRNAVLCYGKAAGLTPVNKNYCIQARGILPIARTDCLEENLINEELEGNNSVKDYFTVVKRQEPHIPQGHYSALFAADFIVFEAN